MRRLLLAGAAVFAVALAWAQPFIGTQSLTGTELVDVTLNSGTGAQVPLYLIRNSSAIVTTANVSGIFNIQNLASTVVFTAALTGPITFNAPGTFTGPQLSAFDGERVTITNGTAAAFTQTITFSSPVTVVNPVVTALAAGSSAVFQYSVATTTWYRIQ